MAWKGQSIFNENPSRTVGSGTWQKGARGLKRHLAGLDVIERDVGFKIPWFTV